LNESDAVTTTAGKRRLPVLVGLGIAVGVLVVLLANAHLVYVSFMSQPDCVAHITASEKPTPAGMFSAAKSAC
jgi:hypothetical protein